MSAQEWPASDYAIGSYIQATVAEHYLPRLQLKASDRVLDLGCGDGGFTKKILDRVPQGSVLGVDASENMLQLAQELVKKYPNFSVKKGDAATVQLPQQFDYVVSFWCLQWVVDIHQAFATISQALKPGGQVLALFPAGDDPYIMGYFALKKSGQFSSLNNFKPPVDYSKLDNLAAKLSDLPYKNLQVELCPQKIILPSLEVFRKFVNGIAFYQGQVSDKEVKLINEALVQHFDAECKKKYGGEYQFNFTIYLVTGSKG